MPGHLLYVWEQLLGVIVAPHGDGPLQHGVGQFLLVFRVLGHGCWRISHTPSFDRLRTSGQAGCREGRDGFPLGGGNDGGGTVQRVWYPFALVY